MKLIRMSEGISSADNGSVFLLSAVASCIESSAVLLVLFLSRHVINCSSDIVSGLVTLYSIKESFSGLTLMSILT